MPGGNDPEQIKKDLAETKAKVDEIMGVVQGEIKRIEGIIDDLQKQKENVENK